jgi:dUTP pyrophosphatase
MALNDGVTVLNSPGCVDSSYRGEVSVVLVNLSQDNVQIRRGERIAQLIIQPTETWSWEETRELPPTQRGDEGFGSSGV